MPAGAKQEAGAGDSPGPDLSKYQLLPQCHITGLYQCDASTGPVDVDIPRSVPM